MQNAIGVEDVIHKMFGLAMAMKIWQIGFV
jgi:hypothetical protein